MTNGGRWGGMLVGEGKNGRGGIIFKRIAVLSRYALVHCNPACCTGLEPVGMSNLSNIVHFILPSTVYSTLLLAISFSVF